MQLVVENRDVSPSHCEVCKIAVGGEHGDTRPDVVGGELGPEWDGNLVEPLVRLKGGIPRLIKRKDLKREVPKGAGTRVHVEVVSSGGGSFVVNGFEAQDVSMLRERAHPHVNEVRNESTPSECMPDSTGEKRRPVSARMVDNHGGLKRVNSD